MDGSTTEREPCCGRLANEICVPRSSGSRSARTAWTSCTTCSWQRATAGSTPSPHDDLTLAKWWGLYPQRPEEDGYLMLRVRVPNGAVTSEQLRAIGDLSVRFGRSTGDVTTRQCLQLHWLRIEDVPEIFDTLERIGLTSAQACGDVWRNVVGCPLAGVTVRRAVRLAADRRRALDATSSATGGSRTSRASSRSRSARAATTARSTRSTTSGSSASSTPSSAMATTSGSAAASAPPRAWAGVSASSRRWTR